MDHFYDVSNNAREELNAAAKQRVISIAIFFC
jgi:hypothetical protein